MAKDYVKGADYSLYLDNGEVGEDGLIADSSPALIKACGDITFSPNNDDIAYPERGGATGHLHGERDAELSFTLMEDKGDTDVETLIAAILSGARVDLIVIRGTLADSTAKYISMIAELTGVNTANRGDPAQYDVTARRHANAPIGMVRGVVSDISIA